MRGGVAKVGTTGDSALNNSLDGGASDAYAAAPGPQHQPQQEGGIGSTSLTASARGAGTVTALERPWHLCLLFVIAVLWV